MTKALGVSFPVVAVGASAGGLEAFTQLLGHLPADAGMAFVLIQHLDPAHVSLLSEALSRATKMTVQPVTDGLRMKPDCVYVIPPNADVALAHGVLTLLPRSTDTRKPHLPIDFFFRTLAQERGNQAIGVVLSGTASDGTAGLRAIKAADGITFVQEPATAKFSGMPQSAVDAGVADYVLPLDRLADELVRLSRHPYLAAREQELQWKRNDGTLRKIFVLVRDATGVDYSEYKPATLERRLARRMALCKVTTTKDYLKLLLENRAEAEALYEDVLIHVTSFFRDPEVFENLKRHVLPQIVASKSHEAPVRVWVAGCSTGEEVYSLAIALLEFLGDKAGAHPIQIFGSDISEKAIDIARLGVYSDAAVRDLSDERRRRFFTKVDRGYQINRAARELCVFVRHDLARDPPFSKLDLVSCRNVLIYFGVALQKRILATFHYCLNRPGFLLLGRTESVSGLSHFFSSADKRDKIFARSATESALRFAMASENRPGVAGYSARARSGALPRGPDLAKHVDRLLLGQYAPPGVVVNDKAEILQFRGHTGAYLEAAPGEPQQNLLRMCREGLIAPLRFALGQAMKKRLPVRRDGVEVRQNGSVIRCNLVVIPIVGPTDTKESLFTVLFEEAPAAEVKPVSKRASRAKSPRAPKVEYELASTKEYLQSVLEEHARTNDELASANEEFVSNNEELQSMNEELETAKEEIQSSNEELTTVNDELHSRNHELSQVNADLINLLDTVDIPMLILDGERRIRRFTSKARRLLNVLQSDIGRRVDDIKPNVNVSDLEQRIADTLVSGTTQESEVQDREGRWYRMQIRPYKNAEGKHDGAILSLIDIDALKHNVDDAEWARDYALGIVDAVQVPFMVLDENLHAISANDAFYRTFDLTKSATEDQALFNLDGGGWDIPLLRGSLMGVIARDEPFQDLELEHDFPRRGAMTLRFAACAVHSRTRVPMILLSIEDITARRRAEDERSELLAKTQAAKAEAERANAAKDEFLATLSHELRTPLSAMLIQAQLLRRGGLEPSRIIRASELIERNVKVQVQLIDDLLDVSRIVAGKLSLQLQPVNLAQVVQAALENVSALAERKSIKLEVALSPGVEPISGDPTRLQQVVWNLLTNAIKFTPERGTVNVALDASDGTATVRVHDSGKGIESDFLPKIFDRFTQQDGSITRNYGGLGIGLAIVRHIVELHGGTVRAESLGEGQGATFSVTLPLIAAQRASSEPSAAGSAKSEPFVGARRRSGDLPQLDGLRVLIVDDDATMRESAAELLSAMGANPMGADSAAAALTAIDAFHPEILLCDIAMPGEDGLSFMRRLRHSRTPGKNLPAIALTALAGEGDRQRSLAAGFQEHLSKPVDGTRLAHSLALLSKRTPPADAADAVIKV
ncbi:MAG TPA: chemotaxis protein CheB [Polyangia bacterium]|nr:chemotaxis protein CheB [Polyangia bacterium]